MTRLFWLFIFLVPSIGSPLVGCHSKSDITSKQIAPDTEQIDTPNNDLGASADQLKQICESESFVDADRVEQVMELLMRAGRLFDAIALLETAVEIQPSHHKLRRNLYDAYVATENQQKSIPHGQLLVRARQFDLPLLMSLGDDGLRTDPSTGLSEMATQFPADQRPLIAEARLCFDRAEMAASAKLLRGILLQHPGDVPSLVLLGRVYLSTNDLRSFETLLENSPPEVEHSAVQWISKGDWSTSIGQLREACRCYWEATKCDPNRQEAWTKLAMSVRRNAQDIAVQRLVNAATVQGIETRAEQLSLVKQLKRQFQANRNNSRKIAIEIAKAHQDLGHLWEAEAWTALATTLAPNPAVDVDRIRQSIIEKLSRHTPWQQTESHPELALDLTALPLPKIEKLLSDSAIAGSNTQVQHETIPKIILIDEAKQRNLSFFGRPADHLERAGVMLYQTTGCGGGAIDFDLDGWADLYLVTAGGTPPLRDSTANALFRNQSGTFLDVTSSTATGDIGFGQGVAVGDVNEDGFADLLVLNFGPNTLLINNGDGTFADKSTRLREDEHQRTAWSTSGAIADLDQDGLNDLIVLNYCEGLGPVNQPCPKRGTEIVRSCAPLTFPAALDRFFKNAGDGTFVDVTETWQAIPSVPGRGLGVTVGAFDNQPGNDVFVANDMTVNHYWSRRAGDSFALSETALLRGLASGDLSPSQGSMGLVSRDLDSDGDIDMFVTNFIGETNTYHEQVADGLWRDTTIASGLAEGTQPMVAFGAQAVDFDNNGMQELIVTNGHIDDFSVTNSGSLYAQPMQIFAQHETARFSLLSESVQSEYLGVPHIGRGLWTLDANRDGRTDVAVTHQSEPLALLVNHASQPSHWIEIQMTGTGSARDAIGARLELVCDEKRYFASQTAGDGYMCSNEKKSHFGLGSAQSPCTVKVHWPSGLKQSYLFLDVDARWLLVEGEPVAFQFGPP